MNESTRFLDPLDKPCPTRPNYQAPQRPLPSFKLALFVMCMIIGVTVTGISVLGVDIQVLLLISLTFIFLVAKCMKFDFEDILEGMSKTVKETTPALFIFFMIGIVIGSWMLSGTVPAIIYYGLRLIDDPRMFLPIGLLTCSLTSLATGTSWGTMGTVGVALMGMGAGLGYSPGLTAGMVISGAYLGDKMSPVSDTTVLAAASVNTDLYDHIKSMAYITTPAYMIVFAAFCFIGFNFDASLTNREQIDEIIRTLGETFKFGPLVFIPMILFLCMSAAKIHAIPTMLSGSIVAVIIAMLYQDVGLVTALKALNDGAVFSTKNELVNTLLNRGGIQSMMWSFSLAFIAIALGGSLERMGILKALVANAIAKISNMGLVSTAAIATTYLFCAAMGEVYLAIVLVGSLYKEEFDKKGLKRSMLSRHLEEGGTLMEVFVPWSTGAVFIISTLGVSVFDYGAWALLNWINPLLSIIFSFLGLCILRQQQKKAFA